MGKNGGSRLNFVRNIFDGRLLCVLSASIGMNHEKNRTKKGLGRLKSGPGGGKIK